MLLVSSTPLPSENALAVPCEVVLLQTHKAGNHPHECEDVAQFDTDAGWVALSDGAGEGIFSREWARLLVDSFIRERPNLADGDQTSAWIERCRRAWFEHIDYPRLGWAHRQRVDRHGSGATLLTLRLFRPADTDTLAFQVNAVGDSCSFWVRDGRCKAYFPIEGSESFPTLPDLFTTHGAGAPPVRQAGDSCEPGDRFILATDALARWLYRALESGQPLDWDGLCAMTPSTFQEWIDRLRRSHNSDDPHSPMPIENDDCTMLVVSVASHANMV